MTSGTRRVAALDGLRVLAIAAIIVYHANPSWLPGGYLGVSVFFVLTGYLTTLSIEREIAREGSFDYPRFLLRRVGRLLPSMLVVVGAAAVLCAIFVGWWYTWGRTLGAASVALVCIMALGAATGDPLVLAGPVAAFAGYFLPAVPAAISCSLGVALSRWLDLAIANGGALERAAAACSALLARSRELWLFCCSVLQTLWKLPAWTLHRLPRFSGRELYPL